MEASDRGGHLRRVFEAAEAQAFLKAQGIEVETAPQGAPLSTAAVADRAIEVTVRLECWK